MNTNDDFKRAKRINKPSFKQFRSTTILTDIEKLDIKPKYPIDNSLESWYDDTVDYTTEVINIIDILDGE